MAWFNGRSHSRSCCRNKATQLACGASGTSAAPTPAFRPIEALTNGSASRAHTMRLNGPRPQHVASVGNKQGWSAKIDPQEPIYDTRKGEKPPRVVSLLDVNNRRTME